MMGVLSRWFDPQQRARISALFGPCYVAGHVASWLLASQLVAKGGWRFAFWVPSGLLMLSTAHWGLRVRNDPAEAGLVESEVEAEPVGGARQLLVGLRATFGYLFAHPQLRIIGVACIGMGVIKEGFSFWIPTLLTESMGFAITEAAEYAILVPIAGALGILVSGWLAHRFFRSNELPVMALLMGLLALVMAVFSPLVGSFGPWIIPVLLGLVGASVHGANTLVVTSYPLRHTAQRRVSSIAGLFEFSSYVGAALGGIAAGALVDWHGWGAAFGLWVGAALLGAAIMASAWIRESRQMQA
jgi:sugar phosphate permease